MGADSTQTSFRAANGSTELGCGRPSNSKSRRQAYPATQPVSTESSRRAVLAGAAPRRGSGRCDAATPTSRKRRSGSRSSRSVLGGSAKEIVDLRAQHGVGADAADQLRRFYELKVAASAEPDEIVLEDSQIRRALSTKDFFLVIAAGVEGAPATPRVPVIVNPVGHLWMSERSQVRFGGIRQPVSLVYDLRPGADAAPDDGVLPSG